MTRSNIIRIGRNYSDTGRIKAGQHLEILSMRRNCEDRVLIFRNTSKKTVTLIDKECSEAIAFVVVEQNPKTAR